MDDNGRFLKVVTNGKKKFVTVEKWENSKEGRKNSIEGLAKELGVDRKVVIEALRRTGNYNGMSDAEIAKNLKVGETLVMKDGKVMTEAEAKGIAHYAGDILKGFGKFFIVGTMTGAKDLGEKIVNKIEVYFFKKGNKENSEDKFFKIKYPGVNVTGSNDPNYFWTQDKIPQSDEEWNKLVGTYRYWINYHQEKGNQFCNLWVGYQAAMRGIYLPTIDKNANVATLAIQSDKNFAEIPRLSDGSLDHQKAVNMAKDGYFVMALFYNTKGTGHMAVVMPYGYDVEGKKRDLADVGSPVWGNKVPFVSSYNSGGDEENITSGYKGTIRVEKDVYWEPINWHFGGSMQEYVRYYYYKKKY